MGVLGELVDRSVPQPADRPAAGADAMQRLAGERAQRDVPVRVAVALERDEPAGRLPVIGGPTLSCAPTTIASASPAKMTAVAISERAAAAQSAGRSAADHPGFREPGRGDDHDEQRERDRPLALARRQRARSEVTPRNGAAAIEPAPRRRPPGRSRRQLLTAPGHDRTARRDPPRTRTAPRARS